MKKKVLLLGDQLRVGGAETYFFKIENNMHSKFIELFTAAEDGECKNLLNCPDSFFFLKKNPLINMFKIIKIVRKEKINVIHANSLRLSVMALPAKLIWRKNIKLLYTKHQLTALEKLGNGIFASYINNFIDITIAVCDFSKNEMMSIGVRKEKIAIVPNSTDIEHYKFNSRYLKNIDGPLNIGILARLDEVKNHDLFLDIVELLNKSEVEFEAYIAGDGPLKKEINDKILNRNLNINMLGNVTNVKGFFEEMDVSLLVSHRELFPMSILEAFSSGVIVVAANVGGISDNVKNKKTGYLIEDHSVTDFVNIIKEINDNREKNREIILEARELVEKKYSLKKMIVDLEKIYMEE